MPAVYNAREMAHTRRCYHYCRCMRTWFYVCIYHDEHPSHLKAHSLKDLVLADKALLLLEMLMQDSTKLVGFTTLIKSLVL